MYIMCVMNICNICYNSQKMLLFVKIWKPTIICSLM